MSSSPSSLSSSLHLAVALDGAGWHPAAWREPVARPGDLLTAEYWADIITEAEHGLLDFVTIEDALGLQSSRFTEPDSRTDQVRGRLDAVLIAARVAPLTRHIGLIPTVVATHTEPFHISKAIATLDYVSTGRAGLRIQVSARQNEAAHFGRRAFPRFRIEDLDSPAVRELTAELFEEAGDYIEAVRRLWDSWEDDAEIRDAATGRFIDRDKLHYIDFESRHFSVKGPRSRPGHRRDSRSSAPSRTRACPFNWWLVQPTSGTSPRTTPTRSAQLSTRSTANRLRRGVRRIPCTSSVTWWSSSTTTLQRRRPAEIAWTASRVTRTPVTRRCSPALPRSSRTCSWSGSGPDCPVSGCAPP